MVDNLIIYIMKDTKILFETIVGSQMWSMGQQDSDIDHMIIYQQDTKSILSGYLIENTKASKKKLISGMEHEYQYMEIGHLINLLLKGNINAIWDVTSPIVLQDATGTLCDLYELVTNNLSKSSYASIKGMATSQYKDNEKRPNLKPNKAFKTALRTLQFGATLLKTGKLEYKPIYGVVSREEVESAFEDLDIAYNESELMDAPNEKQFRNYLYKLRTK
jgi:predicted nucleotidyltransferase